MPNFDSRCNFRSAIIAAASIMIQAGATFAQSESGDPNPADAAVKPKAVQQVDQQFQQLLDRAIDVTSKRYLTANSHSPWQIFHYILAMRQDSVVWLGKEKVNAIEWLSTAEPQFDKQPWLLLTPHGAKFHPYTQKYHFEGHPAQFLALLSHSNLPLDYPFHVQGKVVTLRDLVNNTMKEVNSKEEVTWVLWALQHFLKSEASWYNQANEPWSIEKLVQIETTAQVVGAPCGGNHRLFALTRARDKYLLNGGAMRGVWFQADQKIKQHIEIARSLQNPDGSFSSEWYKGPGQTTDVNLRFNTTGHTMEFLAVSLPKERLQEQWVRNAVWMLSRELVLNQNVQIDCGPLFHSLDALILYRDRIRQKPPAIPATPVTPKPLEVAIDPPSVASNPHLKFKSEPMPVREAAKPVPETKSASKPPEVAQVPSDAKLLDTKPSQPLQQSVPTPPRERLPVLDSKPAEVKSNAPKAPDAKDLPVNTDLSAKRRETRNPSLPKIDPTKLANVGQVAPTAKLGQPKTESSQAAPKNSASAPALLPEELATPLGDSSPQNTETKTPEVSVDQKIEIPDSVPVTPEDLDEPCDAEKAIGTESDEPASALEVANP